MALPSLRKNEEWGMSRLSPHLVPVPAFGPAFGLPHLVSGGIKQENVFHESLHVLTGKGITGSLNNLACLRDNGRAST